MEGEFLNSMNYASICGFLLLGGVIEAYGKHLEGKTYISSETVICVKHNAMWLYENCLIFLKKPCTLGIIHRRL